MRIVVTLQNGIIHRLVADGWYQGNDGTLNIAREQTTLQGTIRTKITTYKDWSSVADQDEFEDAAHAYEEQEQQAS